MLLSRVIFTSFFVAAKQKDKRTLALIPNVCIIFCSAIGVSYWQICLLHVPLTFTVIPTVQSSKVNLHAATVKVDL